MSASGMHQLQVHQARASPLGKALEASGLQNKLKSELRYQLIENLKSKNQIKISADQGKKHDLREKALFSLLLEALKVKNKLYSMSVLTPECGLRDGEIMSKADICKVLGISLADVELLGNGGMPLSPTDDVNMTGPTSTSPPTAASLLESLLLWVEKQQQSQQQKKLQKRESMCQTDAVNIVGPGGNGGGPGGYNLEYKLKKLEADSKLDRNKNMTKYLEEKMLLYQQQCEKRYRQEMDAELQRVKALDRQQIRLEEAQKARAEYQTRQLESNKAFSEKEARLKTKEEQALHRLQQKEIELDRKATEQRTLLLRKMEEQNLIVQRKTEWVALEEKRLALARDGVESEKSKFAEERRNWEASRRQLEAQNQAVVDRHKIDVEKNLEQDMVKARTFQLNLEKEKCQIDLIKQQRDTALTESRNYFEQTTTLKKTVVELEDRLKEFKILHEASQRQVAIAAEQTKLEQQQVEKLKTVNQLREEELKRQEDVFSGLSKKEQALLRQQEENQKLLQKQIDDLRRDGLSKQDDLERAVSRQTQSEKDAEDFKQQMLKLREDNIKLKVEVDRLQRRNEDGVLKERELRRVEQLLLTQSMQQGALSPNTTGHAGVRSQDQSPNGTTLDPERLYAKWESDIDAELAATKQRYNVGTSKSASTTGDSSSSNAHFGLERKTRMLNQEIQEFARHGFFKNPNPNSMLSQSVDVDAILKEAELFDGKSYVERSRNAFQTGFGTSQSPPRASHSARSSADGVVLYVEDDVAGTATTSNGPDFRLRLSAEQQAFQPADRVVVQQPPGVVLGSAAIGPSASTTNALPPVSVPTMTMTASAQSSTATEPVVDQDPGTNRSLLVGTAPAASSSSSKAAFASTDEQQQNQNMINASASGNKFSSGAESRTSYPEQDSSSLAVSQARGIDILKPPPAEQTADDEENGENDSFRLDDFLGPAGGSSSSNKIGLDDRFDDENITDAVPSSSNNSKEVEILGLGAAAAPSTSSAAAAGDGAIEANAGNHEEKPELAFKLDDVYNDLLDRRKQEQAAKKNEDPFGGDNIPEEIDEEIEEEIFSQGDGSSFKSDEDAGF
ncbi:unnamed protein product [Amoebophrya sp. A120]|nr:unnamed protein product [Amoebophrya sp. A120]|eukprot:GSA120T00004067001.1